MGKKKRQNQSSNNPVGDSSSESESSNDSTAQAATGEAASKPTCQHIKKSVDLMFLRKNVKTNKDNKSHVNCSFSKTESKTCKVDEADGGGGWVCLRCASFNCAAHRLNHFLVPRSDSHALACHTATNSVWCFKCDKEIPVDAQKSLQSSADFVKKQYNDALAYSPVNHETDTKKMNGETSFLEDKEVSSSKEVEKPYVKDPLSSIPKVRGLVNLGNTCFFNSVLQCLARTPGLAALLDEMDVPGERFTIQLDGVTVDTRLEKVKQSVLSEQLALVLRQVAGGGGGAVNPRGLLSALTSRCRQFEGYDQHDAHELLRHLLDSVHSDDLKRYQKAILDHIGYKNNNLEELDVEKKRFGKKLNQKVCDTIPIRPDHIFKGSLVSILQCMVCGHESKREETFLDLSLPVLPEKAHHIKKKVICSSPVEEKQTTEALSKHQLKKEKKNARKNRKHNKNTIKNDQETQGEPTIEEEDMKRGMCNIDSVDEDQSDADVEDNDEGDQKAEVVESGYSSEKQVSARGSPVATAQRELTVAIPRPTEVADDTSQDSVRVNASNGSPDASPGPGGERERSPSGPDLPDEAEGVDRTAMIYRWSCGRGDGEASERRESGSASLSNSPRSAKDGHSDDNMSVCTSLPENVSMCLNSPVKSGAEDRPESRMDVYSDDKMRSSPVEAAAEETPASLDSGLLSLSLRGIERSWDAETDKSAAETSPEKPHTGFAVKLASGDAEPPEEENACAVPPARPSAIPLPPPPPHSLFTSAYIFDSVPNVVSTSSARFKYHIVEGECSLQSCLHQFTSIEMLTTNNKVGCDACTERANKGQKDGKTVYQNSTKQLLICSLPPVMIFHLKRFEVQRFSFRKLSRPVEFPLVLDISQFCADPAVEPVLYSLYGVVEHSGNMHGGHYVAYVKVVGRGDTSSSRWYYVSDSHVREADERSVLGSQAYLLFYERIH